MKKVVELIVNYPYFLLVLAFNDIWDLVSKLKLYFGEERTTIQVDWLELITKALIILLIYYLALLIKELQKELIKSNHSVNLINHHHNELKEEISRFASREKVKSFMNDVINMERWSHLREHMSKEDIKGTREEEKEIVINKTIRMFPHVSKTYIDAILNEIYGSDRLGD